MSNFIGGAPRAGKSILGQRVPAELKIGWVSADLLLEPLKVKYIEGTKVEWNGAPEAIAAAAGR